MDDPIVADNKSVPVELKAGDEYYFCTCGKSSNQPFCDGSHKGGAFAPKAFVAKEDGEAYLCKCKQTGNAPFCDGSHAQIPDAHVGKAFSLPQKTNAQALPPCFSVIIYLSRPFRRLHGLGIIWTRVVQVDALP